MYLLFRGVRDYERLLSAILALTDSDVQYAPGLLAVHILEYGDEGAILDDPMVAEMDDVPDGYWCSEVVEDDLFLDEVETVLRHYPGKGRMRSTRRK